MKKVLVAGATGYLGKYMLRELKKQGYYIRALARNREKLEECKNFIDEDFTGEVTKPDSLAGVCENIDIVFSSVGITRQKDGMTYMDVDYGGNKNILNEAKKSGVKKFIFVSVLFGDRMRELDIVNAREMMVDELKQSGLEYCIIRPNGFFSDMTELLSMAQKGKIYLFGNGEYRANPIHGADLAEFIVNNISSREKELSTGGPDILTQNEMAEAAFSAAGRKTKIKYIPLWIKSLSLKLIRLFTGPKTYGPVEFFLTVMTMDMIAPKYGARRLKDYYMERAETDSEKRGGKK